MLPVIFMLIKIRLNFHSFMNLAAIPRRTKKYQKLFFRAEAVLFSDRRGHCNDF